MQLLKRFNFWNIFVFFFLGLGVFFMSQDSFRDAHPGARHAWAQYDFLALYQNFVDENISPFEAQTYVINQEYLQYKELKHATVKTAVDFPFHQWFPAQWAKILPSSDLLVMRIYMSLYFTIGLFFLYLLFYEVSAKKGISLLGTMFFGLNGVLLYYHNAFLPSVPSMVSIIVGIYCLVRFKKTEKLKILIIGLIFLTFGVITRTTFFISWLAVAIVFVYHFRRKYWFYWIGALGIILFFQWYKYDYASKYATLWLGSVFPAESWEVYWQSIKGMWKEWLHTFWSFKVLMGLGFLFVVALILNIKARRISKIMLLLVIHIIGSFLFIALLPGQFHLHDYYGIDVFLIPFMILLVYIISELKQYHIILMVLFVVGSWIQFKASSDIILKYSIGDVMQVENRVKTLYKGLHKNQALMDKIQDERLFIPADFCPNARASFLKQEAFVCYAGDLNVRDFASSWEYDYMLTDAEMLCEEVFPVARDISLNFSGAFDEVLLFEKGEDSNNKAFSSFISGNLKKDTLSYSFSDEYLNIDQQELGVQEEGGILFLDLEVNANKLFVTLNLDRDGDKIFYKARPINTDGQYLIYFPKLDSDISTVFYFWNPDQERVDLKIKSYKFTSFQDISKTGVINNLPDGK